MPKPEFEFFDVGLVEWAPVAGLVPGMWERVLARDEDSGMVTRMLRYEPGTDTTANGVQAHSYWEEIYLLEGSLHDLTLGQTFSSGSYACRPPGMRHGPWTAPDGCLMLEFRHSGDTPHPRPAGASEPRPFSAAEFRYACAQFATGVTIVTTRAQDGKPIGVTANSFTSVSLEPPLVLVCLDKRIGSYSAFQECERYAVHVLAGHQAALSTRFATSGIDKFAGLTYRSGLGDVPILPGYLALFECAVDAAHDAGDHTIFTGRVERLDLGAGVRAPLAFFRGKYGHIHEEAAPTLPPEATELWSLGWA